MMKTCGDIEKELETARENLEWAKSNDLYSTAAGYRERIETLEWVLDLEEGEASHFTWTKEWDNTPPKSMEEIMQDIKDHIQSPDPFFKYLKEKSDENKS
jgi:hypothetical protein